MSSTIPFFWHKLISTAALFLITAVFSYLPFVIRKRVRKAGLIMSYCNCLAGGIVLGAMLMHMIPEIMEGAGGCDAHDHDHAGHSHAIAPVSALLGGAIPGVAYHSDPKAEVKDGHKHEHKHDDELKHDDEHKHEHKHKDGHKHKHDHKHKDGHKHKHDHDHSKVAAKSNDEGHDGHAHGFAWGPFFAGVSFLILFSIDRLFLTHSHCADAHPAPAAKKTAEEHHHHHGNCSNDHDHAQHHHDLSLQPDEEHGACHEDDVIGGCHMDGINSSSTKAQAAVFVLALSIHSFLEGMGMATKSTWKSLASFLISLFAHKWLEAFALGTGVAKACFSPMSSFGLIFLYAILTPAGILLGMWMNSATSALVGTSSSFYHHLTLQALDGMALGSFLFVSCIEMIPSEFHKTNKHTPFKFSLLCVGFFAMAAISLLHFH